MKSAKDRLAESLDLVAKLRRSRADVKELLEHVQELQRELTKAKHEVANLTWLITSLQKGYEA